MLSPLVECKNNFRCWECHENCLTKFLFSLPESIFMAILHDSYSSNVGTMMIGGLSMKEAKELQNIKTMSLIVARKKFLECKKN